MRIDYFLIKIKYLDEIFSGTLQIAPIKPDYDKPNPKVGISCIRFSSDNRFMFTRNGEAKSK
jgi:hypothetical protein